MEDDTASSGPWSQNTEYISIKEEPLEEDSNDGEFYNSLVRGTVKIESVSEDEQSCAQSEERTAISGPWIHNLEFISIKGEPMDTDSNDRESYDIVKDTNLSDNDENCSEDSDKLLERHKKKIHLDTKKVSCPVCSKFINNYNLKRHLKCHKTEKDFHCSICSKSFTVKESLDYHMKIHDGRKDVQCSICNRTFMTEKNLNYHITKNHGEIQNKSVDDNKHICCICKKECKTSAGLKKHMKTHSDDPTPEGRYPCSQCDKTFVQLASIKAHLVTHMSQKKEDNVNTQSDSPASQTQQNSKGVSVKKKLQEKNSRVGVRDCYLCFACNKTFKTVRSLSIHKKIHIPIIEKKKIRKFRCATCNKEYMQKSSLDAHLISHMKAYEYY